GSVGGGSLYEQRRNSKDDAFAGAKLLFVPSDDDPMDTRKSTYGSRPTLTPDLLTLVFANPYGWLMKARRHSLDDTFPTPEAVTELNSPRDDASPALSADGLWIYWASWRERPNGDTKLAVYVAHRASTEEPFSHIEEVLDLGAAEPLWLSPDYCSLYYTQNG